ncbi:MAG: VCBS repeat-containing protein [Bacteroidetes bacterium]|nr:VCBS repeat-containing protein [Bacteroidota bacterium]
MKTRLILILIITAGISLEVLSGNDTLRMHDPGNVLANYYNSNTYPTQIARFDLDKPAIIKGFLVNLIGQAGSSVHMHFLGHEGGTALISLMNDLVQPITLTKLIDGKEQIYVELDSPFVRLDNSQFFLAFKDFDGAGVITDRSNHSFTCKSSSGGDYYFQYGINNSGTFVLLSNFNRAFAIDVLVEYPEKESANVFKDVTEEAGISISLSNSTIAAADFNEDGYVDLLIRGKLYQNQMNGKFEDVTEKLKINNPHATVVANAFVDSDNDGDLDIFLFGSDTSVLLVNNSGVFNKKILSLPEFKSFLSFSFADINQDLYPDLFVSQLWKTYPQPELNYFFLNNGSNDFTDNTTTIYPDYDGHWNWPGRAWDPANFIVERNRNSRGSQWIDFDNDGDLDLFITNYFLQPDEFYRNNGDGTFSDICLAKGIDVNNTGSNHGTGVDWYDFDNDGDLDLLLPQFAHPRFIGDYDHRGTAIYRNEGAPDYNFKDLIGQYNNYAGLRSDLGFELEETHAGGAWGDVNNDGLADVLMTVFYGCRYIDFYEQQEDHKFKLKSFEYGLSGINTGTDLVWLDYDNDGRLDLACAIEGQFRLFKNDKYNNHRWIELDLVSTNENKYAIGARATLYAGGKSYMQEICAGRGQKMQKPYRLHFGLAYTSFVDSVVVRWPANPPVFETFSGLNTNQFYTLQQGGDITLSVPSHLNDESNLLVYPNPAKTKISISGLKLFRIDILNALGQTVKTISCENTDLIEIDLNGMNNGIYSLRAQTKNGIVIKKWVIHK